MRITNKTPFLPLSTNRPTISPPISIYPSEIVFENIVNGHTYAIDLLIRNESMEMQKLRVIEPRSKEFKVKSQDGNTKKLAQGLAWKIQIMFMSDKNKENKMFEDDLVISTDNFKTIVPLKAFMPRDIVKIPQNFNLGRLLINYENSREIPITNMGKMTTFISCECDHNSVIFPLLETRIDPGCTVKIELKFKSKKQGKLRQKLKFSNGFVCNLIGAFVDEVMELFGQDGDKLMMVDVGQLFIGERFEQKIFFMNNSNKNIEVLFKTFNKNIQLSDLKVDSQRGNFIMKSLPQEYARELKNSFSRVQVEKAQLKAFSQYENTVIVYKKPTGRDIKKFNSYISGLIDEQIEEEPIIETLVVNVANKKPFFKVPIKFISVFPRIKIKNTAIDFGEVRQRTDYSREITFFNDGERDIPFLIEEPQNIKIEGDPYIEGHKSQTFKVTLRAVKSGKIAQIIPFRIFDGLCIDIKVFATCRSASIRAKKLCTLNSSRDSKNDIKLYETLASCRNSFNKTLGISEELFNRTDVLADQRTNRLKKMMKEHIEVDSSPQLKEPQLSLTHNLSETKLVFPKKQMSTKQGFKLQSRLSIKDITKYAKSLSTEQLSNIEIKQKQLAFGNVFIDTEMTKIITIVNKNIEPILFEVDTEKSECLRSTNTDTIKIEGRSERDFTIKFRPNMLGAICLPLTYIINRNHIFQLYITAYVTLVNLEISTKNIELGFAAYDLNFQKTKEIELKNKGNSLIKCQCRFQEGRHFSVNKDQLQLKPGASHKITITYKPIQNQEEQNDRVDIDKFTVKVVGGAENIIKCIGQVNDAKIAVKQSQICCMWHLISVPFSGKLNFKNLSKSQTLYKIEIPQELTDILTFQKEMNILMKEEKKEIHFTMVSHSQKRISSAITVYLRGGKSMKIPVQCIFISPDIEVSSEVIDFGNIPIMGNNYQQTITLINRHRSDIKLELAKNNDCEDYLIEVKEVPRTRTEQQIKDLVDAVNHTRIKKKATVFKDEIKEKKHHNNHKIIKLSPNVETQLEIKFIPRKLQDFNITFPLKLCGTVQNELLPVPIKIKCTSIEPVIYLHPQKITFQTRIIGEGRTTFTKSFQINNPHNFQIDWRIDTVQNWKNCSFSLNKTKGHLNPNEESQVQVLFKPQNQGYFWQQLDVVVLKQKKISHISLNLEGNAIFPSLKFNCNQILMPIVPLKTQTKSFIILQNHGFQTINISKWKITNNFANVDISINFTEGRLLSLAKKSLKVEIVCIAYQPISFTTMLQFYDEFGTKYEIPLSCTIDNSLMTTYRFLEEEASSVILDRKQNSVKMLPCQCNHVESQNVTDRDRIGCQFIKNWLNHEMNLGVKQFPKCFIESQGQYFCRTVNRMAGCDLIKRFQCNNSDNYCTNIHAYYCESIRALKTEGAFLNQIRPQFLLSYKDYKSYLTSKKLIISTQQAFEAISIRAWTALFYQLCKLFIMNQVTQKSVMKFASFSPNHISSTVYSGQQLLIFKFLNSFLNEEPMFNFCDRVKFLEIIQKSMEKILNVQLSNAMFALKVSTVVMTPQIFVNLVAKLMHGTLSQYGLSLYLKQTDLDLLEGKELTVFLVSYINMLFHYANLTPVCFQASIGDRVTKILEIQNPTVRKAKYKVKIQGSEQFTLEQDEINLSAKARGELKIGYQCRQNKEEQAKLFLIPQKEDINSANIQPLAFKLTTSIISKITLKKIQMSANLYEITTVTLDAELPIDITELAQFSVSVNNADESNPSFYCFQSLSRTLKNNHDRLDLKLIPLTMEHKYCRVSYRSSVFGEFNFEISAKIDPPGISKTLKLKQLKINKEQIQHLLLPKQNQELALAQKYLVDHHQRQYQNQSTKRTMAASKYQVSIVESSYISVMDEIAQIKKGEWQGGKDALQVDFKCLFGKPFVEYSCTLMLKNELARDIRFYKLVTSVAMKPKIIDINVKAKAREIATIKIPIKIAPCEVTVENMHQKFQIQGLGQHFKQNTELTGIFAPEWMMHHQTILTAQNRETLEQVIYHINLQGEDPASFDSIRVAGSSVFEKKVKIPININVIEQLSVEVDSERIKIDENAKVLPKKKWVSATILPGNEEQVIRLKLFPANSSQYFWAHLSIINEKVEYLKPIYMQEVPNSSQKYYIEDFPLASNYQINCEEDIQFTYKVVKTKGVNQLCLSFHPQKQMQKTRKINVLNNQKEYQLQVHCKSPALPAIHLPEIVSYNMNVKTTTINLVNNSEMRGIYRAVIEPKNVVALDHLEFQIKGKEKKQLKVTFAPQFLMTKYKVNIKFESETLPTYQYNFSAISQFKQRHKTIQCEYYSDRDTLKDIYFTNYFSSTQKFTIETQFKKTPFEVVEPTQSTFQLQSGATKKIIVKVGKTSKIDKIGGILSVKMNDKKWVYDMVSLEIKNLNKRITWNCIARQTYYETIEIPDNMQVKSIESSDQISPFLTTETEEDSDTLKLKYIPMKPLRKDQYQIFLLTQNSKYVINCTIHVAAAKYDDVISIKTKEINENGCVAFKLTNTKKLAVPFKAYLLKGLADLSVEVQKNVLEGYGRIGTSIYVKFTSNVFNKRVEDELWVETAEMLWRFKVIGLLSKKYTIKEK